MMKKIWTSEDVVLGLSCCSSLPLEKCEECPFCDVEERCDDYLMKTAADLIVRRDGVISVLEDMLRKGEKNE